MYLVPFHYLHGIFWILLQVCLNISYLDGGGGGGEYLGVNFLFGTRCSAFSFMYLTVIQILTNIRSFMLVLLYPSINFN